MENKVVIDNAEKSNMAHIHKTDMNKLNIYSIVKRFIDVSASLIGIVLLSPVLIIVSILIKSESKGPIIFKQLRAGVDSKPFYIYKFRSMNINAPNISTNEFVDSSSYITKVGRFIRKTSIDELPQLFNIIKGDMSIVGPRPVILREVELIKSRAEYGVDKILPGITGLAQINGRDKISLVDKVKYDKEYLEKRSIKIDAYIMWITVLKVLKGSDTKE